MILVLTFEDISWLLLLLLLSGLLELQVRREPETGSTYCPDETLRSLSCGWHGRDNHHRHWSLQTTR